MNNDAELLRSYVEDCSENAFTQIVYRHIGLVHSTALRRVGGDAHLADDVTQTVFIALARKAPSLRGRATLAGWLYTSTQLAAAEIVRREQRRQHRETAAQSMQIADSSPDPVDSDLTQLRPLLDDAIVELKGDEREAVVLRFFERRTFAEIGAVLLISEEAARKRVDRALAKLHAAFVRRGVTSTEAALGLALTTAGTSAVPTGLAVRISTAAMGQAALAGSSTVATVMATWLPAAAVIVLGALMILPQHRANRVAAAEDAELSRQNQTIPALRVENENLARIVADVRALQRVAASQPAAGTAITAPPLPLPATKRANTAIEVTTEGTIAWEGQYVTLDEFLNRLSALHASAPGGESQLFIRANGVFYGQLFYVLDEARKAGIKHLVVDSDVALDAREQGSWF